MTEKKFHIPSMLVSILALVLGLTGLSIEGIIVAVIAIVFSLKKKETHLIKINIVTSVIAILSAIVMLALILFISTNYGFDPSFFHKGILDLIFGI